MSRRKKIVADPAEAAAAQRQEMAQERLAERDALLRLPPQFERAIQALGELQAQLSDVAMCADVQDLARKFNGEREALHRRVEVLALPSVDELLLPRGLGSRLREEGFETVADVRADLAERGHRMLRAPVIGRQTMEVIRAHIEAFDAGLPPPTKPKRGTKVVTLTKRETLLAQKMGLTPEKAAELLGRGGA